MAKIFQGTSLNDLMVLLKQEVKEITLEDLYNLSFYFNEENKYLPKEYREKHVKSVQNVIINRFTSLKNNNKTYQGNLSDKDINNINELLKKDNNVITNILNIIIIYATYFLKEPIHLPETAFPGNVKICYDGKEYFCPIKKYHINNDNAVCKYCIAKIMKE